MPWDVKNVKNHYSGATNNTRWIYSHASLATFKSNYVVQVKADPSAQGLWKHGVLLAYVHMRKPLSLPFPYSHSHPCITEFIMIRQHIWGRLACYIPNNKLIYKPCGTKSLFLEFRMYPLKSFSFILAGNSHFSFGC